MSSQYFKAIFLTFETSFFFPGYANESHTVISTCEAKRDIKMENRRIWLVQVKKDLDHSV